MQEIIEWNIYGSGLFDCLALFPDLSVAGGILFQLSHLLSNFVLDTGGEQGFIYLTRKFECRSGLVLLGASSMTSSEWL